jgi:hypothetical protein
MRSICLALAVVSGALALSACQPVSQGPAETLLPLPPRSTPSAEISIMVLTSAPPTAAPALPADLVELGAGQHISAHGSYTDTETLAAGPMICQIARNSPAFTRLVTYPGADVLFSESEPPPYDQEDRLMHAALVLPLSKLAQLTMTEWGEAARIMVNEAYDSRLSHDLAQSNLPLKYSLHFEGRSLDVIPWPPNLGRLARLCALAHQAGFDWVHNEGDHCHMSVEAESLCPRTGSTALP